MARGLSTTRTVAIAVALGLAAGAIAIYAGLGDLGNSGAGSCAAARGAAPALLPLARGEVAAFLIERDPVPAPNLAFTDGAGRPTSLADFRGRTVLLNLWATWCAPCRQEMPALDRLQGELGGPAFQVVAVSIDIGSDDKPKGFYREVGIERLAFFHDPAGATFRALRAAGRAFGMPTTVLIDPQGCIRGHLAGPAEWASPDALRLIRAAIGG